MGRDPRVIVAGGIYHLIQRGNNKEHIFEAESAKSHLLAILKKTRKKLHFNLFGFVLMSNHYHFIMQPTAEAPLNTIMHRINNNYSKYYNSKHQRSGHVFEGRYKSLPVQDEKYIFSLLCYIHRNPVTANICSRVEQYEWSSDFYYRNNIQNDLVDIDFVLDLLGDNRERANLLYRKFMGENLDGDSEASKTLFEEAKIIGGVDPSSAAPDLLASSGQPDPDNGAGQSERKSYSDRESHSESENHPESHNESAKIKTLDQILKEAIYYNDDDFLLIKSGSRKRRLTKKKAAYIKKAAEEGYTLTEIGRNINISAEAACSIRCLSP